MTQVYQLYKSGSAENHAASDDVTLRTELIRALNMDESKKQDQGGGVWRVRINDGHGYLVYKVVGVDATIFHYHWNYNLDLPLVV